MTDVAIVWKAILKSIIYRFIGHRLSTWMSINGVTFSRPRNLNSHAINGSAPFSGTLGAPVWIAVVLVCLWRFSEKYIVSIFWVHFLDPGSSIHLLAGWQDYPETHLFKESRHLFNCANPYSAKPRFFSPQPGRWNESPGLSAGVTVRLTTVSWLRRRVSRPRHFPSPSRGPGASGASRVTWGRGNVTPPNRKWTESDNFANTSEFLRWTLTGGSVSAVVGRQGRRSESGDGEEAHRWGFMRFF